MAGFLRPDSAFYRAWSAAADLVVVNVVTLAACLPIVTAGAALTACARVTMEMARDEDVYTVRSWWRSWRTNLVQSLAWWLPVVVLVVLVGGMNLILSSSDAVPSGLSGLLAAGCVILVAILVWLVPLIAFFDNSVRAHAANAVRLAVGCLGRTAVCVLIALAPVALVVAVPAATTALAWFMALIGLGFQAYLMALVQRSVIDRLRQKAS